METRSIDFAIRLYNRVTSNKEENMTQTLTISEVRNSLTRFPARFRKGPVTIEVTQRGKPVMALLPWEFYESLVETLEVMGDEKLMKALRSSARQIKAGKTYSTEEVERRLGL